MMIIEYYSSATDRSNHSEQPLSKVMKWATNNEKLKTNTNTYHRFLTGNHTPAEKSEKKLSLFPCVQFAGTFGGSGKAVDIINMSGLIVIDFDHVKDLEKVREQLKTDKYVYMLFTSPSKDGVKVIIKHNLTDPNKWKGLFNDLLDYFAKNHNIIADLSGKDISRMCFLPFMNDLFWYADSEVFEYISTYNEEQPKERQIITEDSELYKECAYLSAFLIDNNINITDNYQDWLTYGYSLADLGEAGRQIFNNISMTSEKYDYNECNDKYDFLLEDYDPERITINYYLKNVRYAIADYMLFKNYNYHKGLV